MLLFGFTLFFASCGQKDHTVDVNVGPSNGNDTSPSDDTPPADGDADNDGDGYTNAEEELAGTNPDFAPSRPYAHGNYNVGFCGDGVDASDGPTVETSIEFPDGGLVSWSHYDVGDTVENLVLKDQHGQDVELYAFCGHHVMLVLAAFT